MKSNIAKRVKFPIAFFFLVGLILKDLWSVFELFFKYDGFYVSKILLYTVPIVLQLCLAIILCTRKNNIFLSITLALFALFWILYTTLNGIWLYPYPSPLLSLLKILKYVAILLVALAHCDNGKVKKFFGCLSKVSVVLAVVACAFVAMRFWVNLQSWLSLLDDIAPFVYSFDFIIYVIYSVIEILFFAFLSVWLINPYAREKQQTENVSGEKKELNCGLIKHILLLSFTFGVWTFIWIYRTTKLLNNAPGVKYKKPVAVLLLCMFVPFYQIYWLYDQGKRIDIFSRYKKINSGDIASTCLLLAFFGPMVAYVLMQDRINTLCLASEQEVYTGNYPNNDRVI